MNFGVVLEALKAGRCVARAGWVSGTEIFLVEGSDFSVNRPPLNKIFSEGVMVRYSPHIDILLPSEVMGPKRVQVWTPVIEDLLAEDWSIVA